MRRSKRAALVVSASVLLALGCSSRAVVSLRDGSTVTGVILPSDDDAVRVDPKMKVHVSVEREGQTLVRVPREAIEDIDHPGNVTMVLGFTGAAVAIALTAWTLDEMKAEARAQRDLPPEEIEDHSGATVGFIYGLITSITLVSVGVAGLVEWSRSTRAAGRPVDRGETRGVSVDVGPGGVLVRF